MNPHRHTDLTVCIEWMDGSGGSWPFDTPEEAQTFARSWGGQACRVWIGDDQIQQGFVAPDDTGSMF